MKRTLTLILLALSVVLGACAEAADTPTADRTTDATDTVTSEDRVQQPPVNSIGPSGQGRTPTGPFFLDSAQVNVAESFPLQVFVAVEGNQPTPCDEVDWTVTVEDDRIDINLYTVADPARTCMAVLHPVSFTIPLGDFATGAYTIYLNDEEVGRFET